MDARRFQETPRERAGWAAKIMTTIVPHALAAAVVFVLPQDVHPRLTVGRGQPWERMRLRRNALVVAGGKRNLAARLTTPLSARYNPHTYSRRTGRPFAGTPEHAHTEPTEENPS
jgi:hypothetical protein